MGLLTNSPLFLRKNKGRRFSAPAFAVKELSVVKRLKKRTIFLTLVTVISLLYGCAKPDTAEAVYLFKTTSSLPERIELSDTLYFEKTFSTEYCINDIGSDVVLISDPEKPNMGINSIPSNGAASINGDLLLECVNRSVAFSGAEADILTVWLPVDSENEFAYFTADGTELSLQEYAEIRRQEIMTSAWEKSEIRSTAADENGDYYGTVCIKRPTGQMLFPKKYSYTETDGGYVYTGESYDDIYYYDDDSRTALVLQGTTLKVVGLDGNVIEEYDCEFSGDFSEFHVNESEAQYTHTDRRGSIGKVYYTAKPLIDLENGCVRSVFGSRYGITDKNGETVLNCNYDGVWHIDGTFWFVRQDKDVHVFNTQTRDFVSGISLSTDNTEFFDGYIVLNGTLESEKAVHSVYKLFANDEN